MTNSNKYGLNQCPICSSQSVYIDNYMNRYKGVCRDCMTSTSATYDNIEDAIKQWNIMSNYGLIK